MNTPWFWFLDFPKKNGDLQIECTALVPGGARITNWDAAETYSGPMQSPFFVLITSGALASTSFYDRDLGRRHFYGGTVAAAGSAWRFTPPVRMSDMSVETGG